MPKKKNSAQASNERVRIRMYRHGLGDCFLLRFPGSDGKPVHFVIDSGVIKGTSAPERLMREVAEDIKQETNGRIDVLVVTHEHWDHVSGFTEAREVWDQMDIDEVWLAWTENPKEELANKLRKDRETRKAAIKTKMTAIANTASFRLDSERVGRLDSLTGFLGFGLGVDEEQGGTKGALDYISKKGKARRYHSPEDVLTHKKVPDVRIYVLGPPKDERKIKQSDPSRSHPEVYMESRKAFGFAGTGEEGLSDWAGPFEPSLGRVVKTAKDYDVVFSEHFPELLPGPTDRKGGKEQKPADPEWRRLDFESIEEVERLALALDGDTNNTSLALAFELQDGKVLLFPADAQVGNWLSWQDCTWKVKGKAIKIEDLFKRTVFYKVGHHGSHNATLKDLGLEKMIHQDLVAFIPVNKAMALKKKWKMPFAPLFSRLQERTRGRVCLADATEQLPKSEDLSELTATERKNFTERVSASGLFIDFSL